MFVHQVLQGFPDYCEEIVVKCCLVLLVLVLKTFEIKELLALPNCYLKSPSRQILKRMVLSRLSGRKAPIDSLQNIVRGADQVKNSLIERLVFILRSVLYARPMGEQLHYSVPVCEGMVHFEDDEAF